MARMRPAGRMPTPPKFGPPSPETNRWSEGPSTYIPQKPYTTLGTAASISTRNEPVRRNQALAKERQAQAEALIHNDPFVQDMVRNWGGKVVPGSIKHTVHAAA